MATEMYDGFMKLVALRYSCRAFSSRPVAREDLVRVVEAARLAPSACNRQPWRFVVADGGELLDSLRRACRKEGFKAAPAFIVAVGLHDQAWHRPDDGKDHTDVDLSIAVEHICLAAAALGLGSCWVCSFDLEAVARALSLPEGEEAVALIPLGYPAADDVPAKVRKPIDDILRW